MNIFKAVLTGAAAVFLCMSAQAEVADRIVAVVNDEVITLSELNSAFEPYRGNMMASHTGADREKVLVENRMILLNQMIDNLLLEQQSRKAGIVITDAELMNAIKDLLRRRNLSQDNLQNALDREGTTLEGYRKGVRDQLMRIKLLQREIKSRVAVSDEEIGAYYRKHREDYEGKETVRIRQILLLLPKEEEKAGKAKIRADAEAIHKNLLDGESFELLSARYSQGSAAAGGGDIGYIEKGMILHEVEEVAFKLSLNQISGVIESPVGFHIIQVIDRRGAGIKSIESVREEIREKIDQEKIGKKFDEWMGTLRMKSHIEIKMQ
jgi:peptidyl-prolyl cis-trans isomerase SurA